MQCASFSEVVQKILNTRNQTSWKIHPPPLLSLLGLGLSMKLGQRVRSPTIRKALVLTIGYIC